MSCFEKRKNLKRVNIDIGAGRIRSGSILRSVRENETRKTQTPQFSLLSERDSN